MSIFEYNEAEEKEKLRKAEYEGGYQVGVAQGLEQGIEQGIEQGQNLLLMTMVEKKLNKGKSLSEIARELEVEMTEVEKMLQLIERSNS